MIYQIYKNMLIINFCFCKLTLHSSFRKSVQTCVPKKSWLEGLKHDIVILYYHEINIMFQCSCFSFLLTSYNNVCMFLLIYASCYRVANIFWYCPKLMLKWHTNLTSCTFYYLFWHILLPVKHQTVVSNTVCLKMSFLPQQKQRERATENAECGKVSNIQYLHR